MEAYQGISCVPTGCRHVSFCSTLRAYVADREIGGEYYGDWCPCAASYRDTLARAGVTLPRADGTFDPVAVAAAKDAFAAATPREGSCITLGEIIAWRTWIIRDDCLLSPFREILWPTDRPMAGDPGVGFGIFAFKERHRAIDEARLMSTRSLSVAYGSVRIWGEVIEHRRGYRAEFARIATLDGVHPADSSLTAALTAVCRRYGLAPPDNPRSREAPWRAVAMPGGKVSYEIDKLVN